MALANHGLGDAADDEVNEPADALGHHDEQIGAQVALHLEYRSRGVVTHVNVDVVLQTAELAGGDLQQGLPRHTLSLHDVIAFGSLPVDVATEQEILGRYDMQQMNDRLVRLCEG